MTATQPPVPPGTWVVVPCFNNPEGARQVVSALPRPLRPYTLFVDDGSTPALQIEGVEIVRHPANRGYGGAQKTGYRAALERGAERVVLLHGDHQYETHATLGLAQALAETGAHVALGSRFLGPEAEAIPRWRRSGNRLLTALANRRFGTRQTELHTGARAFSGAFLRALPLDQLSDDYVFDQQVLCAALAAGLLVAERPVRARYDPGVQSITFQRSVAYGLGCLASMLRPPSLDRDSLDP